MEYIIDQDVRTVLGQERKRNTLFLVGSYQDMRKRKFVIYADLNQDIQVKCWSTTWMEI